MATPPTARQKRPLSPAQMRRAERKQAREVKRQAQSERRTARKQREAAKRDGLYKADPNATARDEREAETAANQDHLYSADPTRQGVAAALPSSPPVSAPPLVHSAARQMQATVTNQAWSILDAQLSTL